MLDSGNARQAHQIASSAAKPISSGVGQGVGSHSTISPAETPQRGDRADSGLPADLAAFLKGATTRQIACLLGLTQRRVQQLRARHQSPRLSAIALARWRAHAASQLAAQHPQDGPWALRRVRRASVRLQGHIYDVPISVACEGQQLAVAPAASGALLVQALDVAAAHIFAAARRR